MALPSAVATSLRTLMGPGPSDVHPRVLRALSNPTLGHLDPEYLELMDQLQEMLRSLFRTTHEMTIAISGTGSAGQEAAVVNLVEPGDPVIVCVNGVFGGRLVDMVERTGGVVTRVERPWGEVFRADDLREALSQAKPKVVALVMAETSTGAWQPIEEISEVVHQAGALLLVDAVTALGGIPVEVDKWNIDAIYSATQKCLGCPPGLAPISFSPQAVEKVMARREKVQSWYFDVSMLAAYWGENRVYHHTAPINMTYALHEALRMIHEEGLEACFQRHHINHEALRMGLSALDIGYATEEGYELPQLNAVFIPQGIDDWTVRSELLRRFGIEIGSGLGPFKGRVWRIGLMGQTSQAGNVLGFLSALEQILAENGHSFEHGSSVAAANRSYRENVLAT